MEIRVVGFDGESAPLIRQVRNAVFTGEQGIDPEMDFDGRDGDAVHVLALCSGGPAGTGRMLHDGHIGRLAVLKAHRQKGVGARMVQALLKAAEDRNLPLAFLGAQKHAVGFYTKLGFSVYGEPYSEVGIDHVHMKKAL